MNSSTGVPAAAGEEEAAGGLLLSAPRQRDTGKEVCHYSEGANPARATSGGDKVGGGSRGQSCKIKVFFYFFVTNRIHFSAVCSPQVCQKSGEISLLKQQLKEIQSELSQKAGDIVVLKAQLREARSELQASQARSQEAQTCLRTRSLELEVCENELQRRKSEAELLREKVGRLEEESVRLRETASNQSGHSLPGNAFVKGHCMNPTLPHVRGVAGRGGPSPSVYRDAEEQYVMWGGESDEAKAQRQNTETVLSLRQQVLFFVAQKKTHSSYSIYSVFKYFIS